MISRLQVAYCSMETYKASSMNNLWYGYNKLVIDDATV